MKPGSAKTLVQPAVHLLGHLKVHAVEAGQPIAGRCRCRDGLHLRYRPGTDMTAAGGPAR
jgi:hypothetical protein